MTDIVERLRNKTQWMNDLGLQDEAADLIELLGNSVRLMRESAVPCDEYEILRAENEGLRAQIEVLKAAINGRDDKLAHLRGDK